MILKILKKIWTNSKKKRHQFIFFSFIDSLCLLMIVSLFLLIRVFTWWVTSKMTVKSGNSKTNIFGNIFYFLFVISDNTDLEKLQILAMCLKGCHVSFHHVVHSVSLFSVLDFCFLEVRLYNFFGVLGCMFEKQWYNGLVFCWHLWFEDFSFRVYEVLSTYSINFNKLMTCFVL